MNTFKYFEIMERYSRGPMTPEERTGFEKQLQTNQELAAEWADYLLIARSVRNSLRTQSSQGPNIKDLVREARDLAQESGLLLTDEDIWLYLRNQAPGDKKQQIEKRLKEDNTFAIRFAKESAIVSGIRNYATKLTLIDRVRESLNKEGFTQQIHQQIEQDIEEEVRRTNNPFNRPPKGPPSWPF
jgi:hypothetical protein